MTKKFACACLRHWRRPRAFGESERRKSGGGWTGHGQGKRFSSFLFVLHARAKGFERVCDP